MCGALNWNKVDLPENTPKSTRLLPLSDVAKASHFLSSALPMGAITLELQLGAPRAFSYSKEPANEDCGDL